jgi:hypothetical protein
LSNDKFIVQDGLTINTIEVFTADGVLIGPSGNTLNASYTHANSAYDQANLAFNAANSQAVFVQSNVINLVSGSDLVFNVSYGNLTYPGGLFTLEQQGPVSLVVSDVWQGGTANKNAYLDYTTNTVNTKNVAITLALSNATFNVQTTDTINIGSSTITGSNLLSLGITNTGGSYVIPNSFFASEIETNSNSSVSVNLTTNRRPITTNGTTLTNTQPTPFNVTSLTANFPINSVPYFNKNQSFSWNANVVGSVASGNVTYSGTGSSGTLTSTGGISGSSPSLDSTIVYTITSNDYRGAGLNGAGTRTIPSTVSTTTTAATSYKPLFYKTTGNNSNPNISTSDTYLPLQYNVGQGAGTTDVTSNYLWLAIPGTSSHAFAFTFLNTTVVVTPDVTYTNQTIATEPYNVYGFTNFSAQTIIYTTS